MAYRLDYLAAASKSIEQLSQSLQRRVLQRLEKLKSNPRPLGSIKLAGSEQYRIRVGDYRILYMIEDDRLIVLVVDVGHRREVYRRKR